MSEGLGERLTELLGIERPILGAPMGGVTRSALAAAVSEAGGLGILGMASATPQELREEIRSVRRQTSRPFGVGLIVLDQDDADTAPDASATAPERGSVPEHLRGFLHPDHDTFVVREKPALTTRLNREQLEVVFEERVGLLACGIRTPAWVVEEAHRHGIRVLSLVGSVRAARQVAAAGTDAIVAQGHEAGGHTGATTTFVLVPAVVDAVDVPVVAAGGIVDGRGMAAAMTLGAEGVLVGTRLLATPEASTAQTHKDAVVDMTDDRTIVSRAYTGKPSRMLRNRFIEAWKGKEGSILPMPEQWRLVEPVVAPWKAQGDLDIANWPTGQGAMLVGSIQPAGEVVRQLHEDCTRIMSTMGSRASVGGRS